MKKPIYTNERYEVSCDTKTGGVFIRQSIGKDPVEWGDYARVKLDSPIIAFDDGTKIAFKTDPEGTPNLYVQTNGKWAVAPRLEGESTKTPDAGITMWLNRAMARAAAIPENNIESVESFLVKNNSEGMELDQDFINPGARIKLREWLEEKGMKFREDPEDRQVMYAQLTDNVKMMVYHNRLVFYSPTETGTDISAKDLESATRVATDMLKTIYGEGKVPAVKVFNNDPLKGMEMAEVLKQSNLSVTGELGGQAVTSAAKEEPQAAAVTPSPKR